MTTPGATWRLAAVLLACTCGETTPPDAVPVSTTAEPGTSSGTTTVAASSTTATIDVPTTEPGCAKNVVLMGYWPPTNEMLRPWSRNPEQNPERWIGENWDGLGFDVYAFFPEFPPDGDPRNDRIGEDGAVGSAAFDLRVDYQATSADFWRIVETYRPVILVTTSRGGTIGWEIEAIEGGHEGPVEDDPSRDWSSDRHGDVQLPTETSIDARSWAAISTYRLGRRLPTRLPTAAILEAASALGRTTVAIDETGTSGNFLSGFLGLHGLYYNQTTPHNVAAGHIHVGIDLPLVDARVLIETSLRAVLTQHPAATIPCPPAVVPGD